MERGNRSSGERKEEGRDRSDCWGEGSVRREEGVGKQKESNLLLDILTFQAKQTFL